MKKRFGFALIMLLLIVSFCTVQTAAWEGQALLTVEYNDSSRQEFNLNGTGDAVKEVWIEAKDGKKYLYTLSAVIDPGAAVLTGKIIDDFSGKPLEGVKVTAGKLAATTDKNGIYKLSLAADTYDIVAMKNGYKDNKSLLRTQLGQGETRNINLSMVPTAIGKPNFLDLTSYVNSDWNNHSYSPRELPVKKDIVSLYSGIPFRISEDNGKYRIVLNGNWENWGNGFPSQISVKFNDMAKYIAFFGHTYVGTHDEADPAKYIIVFNNGKEVAVPLVGKSSSPDNNIDDWACNWSNNNLPKARLAWVGKNGVWNGTESTPEKSPVIREFLWRNPYPSVKIKEIRYIDTGTDRCPMLLGITYFK